MRSSRKPLLLLVCSLGLGALGTACGAVFTAGLLRDGSFGEARLPLDLGREAPRERARLRVWKPGPHRLALTTVNHDPEPVGRRFGGRVEAQIRGPKGRLLLSGGWDESVGHRMPDNFEWTLLREVRIDGGPLDRVTLEARVTEADPAFGSTNRRFSELVLRPVRTDVGMGGLINYVMLFPAALFLLLGLGAGLWLAGRGGTRVPALVNAAALAALATAWSVLS